MYVHIHQEGGRRGRLGLGGAMPLFGEEEGQGDETVIFC